MRQPVVTRLLLRGLIARRSPLGCSTRTPLRPTSTLSASPGSSSSRDLPRPLQFVQFLSGARLFSTAFTPQHHPTIYLQNLQNQKRRYSGVPPPRGSVQFWPFFLIIALGSGAYYLLALKRHEAAQDAVQSHRQHSQHSNVTFPVAPPKSKPEYKSKTTMAPTSSTEQPAFSPDDVTVLFVLGGPGAGKGTQSSKLVEQYGFTHLSAGDLLRAEQAREGSRFGELISRCIRDGAIVPMEVTVKLLENAMRDALVASSPSHGNKSSPAGEDVNVSGMKGKFLIDGFPRKMDQALKFEESVCPARYVLFFDVPEDELERRLLERGKTSGRADDNPDSIRKRFRTFVETSMPVVDHYAAEGRVIRIRATDTIDKVFAETRRVLEDNLGRKALEE